MQHTLRSSHPASSRIMSHAAAIHHCHTAMPRRRTTVTQESCNSQCYPRPPPYYGTPRTYILSGISKKDVLTCLTLNTFPMRSIRSPLTTTTVSPLENSGICAPRHISFSVSISVSISVFGFRIRFTEFIRFGFGFVFFRFSVFGRRFRFHFRLVWYWVGSISVPIGSANQPPRGESSGQSRKTPARADADTRHKIQSKRHEARETRHNARDKRHETRDKRH